MSKVTLEGRSIKGMNDNREDSLDRIGEHIVNQIIFPVNLKELTIEHTDDGIFQLSFEPEEPISDDLVRKITEDWNNTMDKYSVDRLPMQIESKSKHISGTNIDYILKSMTIKDLPDSIINMAVVAEDDTVKLDDMIDVKNLNRNTLEVLYYDKENGDDPLESTDAIVEQILNTDIIEKISLYIDSKPELEYAMFKIIPHVYRKISPTSFIEDRDVCKLEFFMNETVNRVLDNAKYEYVIGDEFKYDGLYEYHGESKRPALLRFVYHGSITAIDSTKPVTVKPELLSMKDDLKAISKIYYKDTLTFEETCGIFEKSLDITIGKTNNIHLTEPLKVIVSNKKHDVPVEERVDFLNMLSEKMEAYIKSKYDDHFYCEFSFAESIEDNEPQVVAVVWFVGNPIFKYDINLLDEIL